MATIAQLDDTYEELRSVLRHYDSIHRVAEGTRIDHMTIEKQVADIRRAYTDKLYADIATSPELKIKFSNQERRDAEVQRRLESDIPKMLQQEQEAREARQEAAAELERSEQALKTMRALAALVDAQIRMETETMAVASMPRMIRR